MITRAQSRSESDPAVATHLLHWRELTDLTIADIENLVRANAFSEYDGLELMNGSLVPMSPKGRRHEAVREELAFKFTREVPAEVFVTAEPQLNLAAKLYLQPDILLRPMTIKTPDLRGPMALLVIEVADTCLPFNIQTKSAIYAAHGVRDYWVIIAATLMTTVHLLPSADGYGSVRDIPPNQLLVPSLVSALSVQLDQLDV
jgi:Uma2 family endonuclease